MGIKRTRTIYVSDRGEEYALEEMQFSHLVNAHAHHVKQLTTLVNVCTKHELQADHVMTARCELMRSTIEALELEMINRDLNDEHVERSSNYRRDYGGW